MLLLGGCQPSGQRPGLWLSGELQTFPADWSFTQDHREIGLQVATPYLIPHSVTIWCVSIDGDLYIAALAPQTKKWPSWVNDNPDIVVKIGEELYAARAMQLQTPALLLRLQFAYSEKYDRALSDDDSWLWRLGPRS